MTIDISQLLRKKILKQSIHLEMDKTEVLTTQEEIKVTKPVSINGSLTMASDIVALDAQITTELLLQCSRCIENFTYALDISIHEEFTNNRDNRDDNVIFIDSDNIDITDIIDSNIILALPIKSLCSENCKGLCQICGTNLNVSTCNCGDKDVDPRFAKLKDLFSTD
jgi:uncharacterized protein